MTATESEARRVRNATQIVPSSSGSRIQNRSSGPMRQSIACDLPPGMSLAVM